MKFKTDTDTRGAAPDPVHLSSRPSKVEPKNGARTGILDAKTACPRYRDETCPARNTAIFQIQDFKQSSRFNPAGSRLCLNSLMGNTKEIKKGNEKNKTGISKQAVSLKLNAESLKNDMNGNVLAEADGSKAITKYYVHGQGLIGMVTASDAVYSYHYNAIGSTIALTNASQNVVNKYSYKPFGEIMAQEELIPQPFKYVGQYGVMAESNGFYYMRARYYDPKVGRFVSEDPIGFEGGTVNFYEYSKNNPVVYSDPSGLTVYRCFGRIRKYLHSYVCVNQKCAGLMPEESCSEGGQIQSEDFNPAHCKEHKLDVCCDQNKYENCVSRLALSRVGACGYYGTNYNCTSWVNTILATCQAEACEKK